MSQSVHTSPTAQSCGGLSWQFGLTAFFTVGLLAAVAYWPITGAYFRHDDFSWLRVAQQWQADSRSLAHGDTGVTLVYNIIYDATYRRWGLNPKPYFVWLLCLHVLNCWLVMMLTWLVAKRAWAMWMGGLFFALLFSHHEAVTWPAAGLHVLVAAFFLGAVLFWMLYRQGRNWALILSVLCTLLALMTKDSGVAIIPLLVAADWLLYPRTSRRPLFWHAAAYVVLAGWRVILPPLSEAMEPGSEHYHFGAHMLWNLVSGPPQMLVPDLRFENYMHFLQQLLPAQWVTLVVHISYLAVALLTVFAVWGLWRGSAQVRLGILWCYLAFLPFLPFSYDYARAPRYLYVPSVGLALLVGLLAAAIADRMPAGWNWNRFLALLVVIVFVSGSLGFAWTVCSNRLRDSRLRQHMVLHVTARLATAQPGTVIHLCGLPDHLCDVVWAVPLYYPVAMIVRDSCDDPPPGGYFFRFDPTNPVRLMEYHPAPSDRESTEDRPTRLPENALGEVGNR